MATGRIAAEDVELARYGEITGGETCDASIGGLEILTGDPFDADAASLSLAARNASLAPDCIPLDAGSVAVVPGPSGLDLPELVADGT